MTKEIFITLATLFFATLALVVSTIYEKLREKKPDTVLSFLCWFYNKYVFPPVLVLSMAYLIIKLK